MDDEKRFAPLSGAGNEAFLLAAIDQSSEAIVVTDAEGVIEYVNPAFERITGYSRAEAVGRTPRLLNSGEHDGAFYRALWETLQRGDTWRGEFTNRRKDGTLYREQGSIAPVRDAAGRIVRYVAVKRDVTREEALEQQVRQGARLEAIGQLAGGVAHDFNNLLTVIMAEAELIRDHLDGGSPARDYLEELVGSARRASELSSQLLVFSRRQEIVPVPLDLNAVLQQASGMLQRLLPETIALRLETTEGLWPIQADAGQVNQVILNLCVNARDAMPGGGSLVLDTANLSVDRDYAELHGDLKAGDYAVLTVQDTGGGMDESTRRRAFEPFFTTKPQGEGTGLGLATVYGVVKRHGGGVWVYSEPGHGTTFKVYFPRAETAAEAAAEETRPPPALTGTETVLVVEDEEMVRRLACRMLTRQGYHVLEVEDARAALRVVRRHRRPIDLLLTDVIMPGLNGSELYCKLSRAQPGLRVLYMSGYSGEVLARQGLLQSEIRLLRKPFGAQELAAAVRAAIEEE